MAINLTHLADGAAIGIVRDTCLQPEAAIVETLAIFAGHHLAVLGGEPGFECCVFGIREREVDRQLDEGAQRGGGTDDGGEKPAAMFHCRVGLAVIRSVEHRYAEQFQRGIAEADFVAHLIIDHAIGFHLPYGRALAGLVADFTGRVGGAECFGIAALAAPGTGGNHAAILADQRRKTFQRAVAHIVTQRDMVGKSDIAIGRHQADIAFGSDRVLFLVVGNTVGQQDAPAIVDFDVAFRCDHTAAGVVDDLIGLQQHIVLRLRLRLRFVLGSRIARQARCQCQRTGPQPQCRAPPPYHPSS